MRIGIFGLGVIGVWVSVTGYVRYMGAGLISMYLATDYLPILCTCTLEDPHDRPAPSQCSEGTS
jgi:hypothetical protein